MESKFIHNRQAFFLLLLLGVLSPPPVSSGPIDNVFQAFTSHISHQVERDKQGFAQASQCTEWFYKRLKEPPPPPRLEGVTYRQRSDSTALFLNISQTNLACDRQYPQGIEGAREDFSRTQSTLTLSLTFYQLALIGDKDDNGMYSEEELEDTFISLGLHAQLGWAPARHASALNSTFDAWHASGQLDPIMAGMGYLLDKGYRLTPHDQQALSHLTG